MIYLIHELTDELIPFIKSLDNVVYLDDYTGKENVITFDSVYKSVWKNKEILTMPFEMFICFDMVGKDRICTWEEIKKLEEMGGRLQWHTKFHTDLRDHANPEDEITPEFECNWFAYPYGEYTPEVIEITKKYFKGAVSVHQGDDSQYALARKEMS